MRSHVSCSGIISRSPTSIFIFELASHYVACLQAASQNSSSTNSDTTTSNDKASCNFWLWLFGLGTLGLAAGSLYATFSTACAAACVMSRLLQQMEEPQPEPPLRLAMSAAALLVALPQLLLVTCTLAWNAFVLLAPLVSTEPCIHATLGKSTATQRISAVTANAKIVAACLAGLVVLLWSMNSAYKRELPVSVVELVVFCGVMLTMCCMVVFWAVDLCLSIKDVIQLNVKSAEVQPALFKGKDGKGNLARPVCKTVYADAYTVTL
jgi:hypothetical protein